jgi:GNAT superfamily N-acetyltransferase
MSSSEIIVRQVRQQELDKFQQRIVQIFLDAFTTDGFAFNAQRATEEKAVRYLRSLFAAGAVAFFAFDSGRVAYPSYPIAFLFGSILSSDPLLSQTPIANAYDVTQCGYIAELAVDRGHRGRGVGHRLIAAYLASCRERRLLDVLVRTNETDQHLHSFYASNGFKKLDITARQDIRTPECCFVTKRYFHYSLR